MQRPSLVEDALAAFQSGEYTKALGLLASCHPCGARADVLLRIALRQRDYDRVWAAARELRDLAASADQRAIGEAQMFFADVARNRTTAAFPETIHAATAVGGAEVALVRAMVEWMRGSTNIRGLFPENPPQTLDQKVRRVALEAWCAASRGDLQRQAELLLNALTRACQGNLDIGGIMLLAHPLAVLLREIELGEIGSYAEDVLRKVPWGRISLQDRYYGERAFAWRRALDGEYIAALTHLDAAMASAPDDLCRGVSHIDAARIALASDAHLHAEAAVELAFTAFERFDWEHASHEEPLGLFGAMDVLSRDRERAERLFQRAQQVMPTTALGVAHGPRLQAYRAFAEAMIAQSSETALERSKEAYRLFRRCGYVFRAASTALRAFEACGDRKWLERVGVVTDRYPRSLFALAYRRYAELPPGLTERRLQVLRGVCAGKTSEQVATDLGLSESTVRKHIGDLHRILGVTRRAELVRRALELKLVA